MKHAVPHPSCRPAHRLVRCFALLLPVLACFTGCAAMHPIEGIPARYLPHELQAPSRSGRRTIDLSLLRQRPVADYRVDSGDLLGIYVEGVLGEKGQAPPVHFSQFDDVPPSLGFPIPVRGDGTLSIPLTGPIPVRGMTLREVELAIEKAYTVDKQILKPGTDRVFVTLQRPRQYRVLVIRQEAGNDAASLAGQLNPGVVKRGTGIAVNLPAYKNDVLHALAESGGLPGLDAENAIYVIRHPQPPPPVPAGPPIPGPAIPGPANYGPAHQPNWGHSLGAAAPPPGFGHADWGHTPVPPPTYATDAWGHQNMTIDNAHIIKIPVRLQPGEPIGFTERDIILNDGDVVFIESRDTEIFYTGGLLGGGQYTLPRDYDLDILGAIAIAQAGGNRGGDSQGGPSALNQDVTISASCAIVLRQLPNGTQVPIRVDLYEAVRNPAVRVRIQPGDYIILQYTPLESVAAFFERHLLEGALFGVAASQFQTSR